MTRTADGINHGTSVLADCFEAVIEKFEDGYTLCPLLWSGGKCEKCYETFRRRHGTKKAKSGRATYDSLLAD